jgi:hypothetical protein
MVLVLAGALLSRGALPAAAQQAYVPSHAWHARNHSTPLSAPAATPLEQQMQQNYRTDLMQAQRELLQANPSGLGREQIGIGHELNMYNATPH